MTRLLLVGGSGVFGSRLAEGLAATTDVELIIAGRTAARAEATASALRARFPGRAIGTATIDASHASADDLRRIGADLVIDAAGPFQGAAPQLAASAVAAGIDIFDLADARDFVARFPALDDAAHAAGTIAVTGASSTPALSHAVLDAITAGWRRIDRIEVGISPGNRAPRGLSVIAAILAWAGQPFTVFADAEWHLHYGWFGSVAKPMAALGQRRLALAETPDLDLLVARYQPRDAALFRAGLELRLLHDGLRLLAWLPRLGLVASLAPFARLFQWGAGLFERFGTDRGGMIVEAAGRDADDRPVWSSWVLVAADGCGPSVPTLPALALVRKWLADRTAIPIGARAAAGLLSKEEIEAEFAPFAITAQEQVHHAVSPFETALGLAFDTLPSAVKAVHRAGPVTRLEGVATVDGAATLPGRWIARLFGFPPAADDVPVHVVIRLDADGDERWLRDFGGQRFRSRLAPRRAGVVSEHFGPFAFDLELKATFEALAMRVAGWRCGPFSCRSHGRRNPTPSKPPIRQAASPSTYRSTCPCSGGWSAIAAGCGLWIEQRRMPRTSSRAFLACRPTPFAPRRCRLEHRCTQQVGQRWTPSHANQPRRRQKCERVGIGPGY